MVDNSRLERLAATARQADGKTEYPKCFENRVKLDGFAKQDAQGNVILVNNKAVNEGHFVYKDNKGEVKIVKELTAIIVDRRVQFRRFTQAGDKKVFNRTTLEVSPAGKFFDTLGTIKLGKKTGKAAEGLEGREKEENAAKGKYTLQIFVLILDETGFVPANLTVGGKNAADFGKKLQDMFKDTKGSIFHTVKFHDIVEHVTGKVTWYSYNASISSDVEITDEILDGVEEIQQAVQRENDFIITKYEMARVHGNKEEMDEVDGDLESDLVDEVE